MEFNPIGVVHSHLKDRNQAPRHYSVSEEEGIIEVYPEFIEGLYRIEEREYLIVLFNFHLSKPGKVEMHQTPPTSGTPKGVFSTCSPNRPNPIGLSIVKLLKVDGNKLHVKKIDMLDGTPVLDIKPYKPL